MYGESSFIFLIVETLPIDLSNSEYEKFETKWVLHYNSHKSKFGYNLCLPGSIPLERSKEMNECRIGKGCKLKGNNFPVIPVICINKLTKEITEKQTYKEVYDFTGIPLKKIPEYCAFWIHFKGKRKSLNNWIIVKKEHFNPEFDYIGYRKNKPVFKKTWRDYEKTRKRNVNKFVI